MPSETKFDGDFFELLNQTAQTQKGQLISSIIENARQGDASALKILEKALLEGRYDQEEKLKITYEQFKNIICLAADRLRGRPNPQS